jgi:hypothetical protein
MTKQRLRHTLWDGSPLWEDRGFKGLFWKYCHIWHVGIVMAASNKGSAEAEQAALVPRL